MALWMVRAGKQGESESKFLTENRIYATWDEFPVDLNKCKTKHEILDKFKTLKRFSEEKINTLRNWMGQLWMFSHEMKLGDWVVLPSKYKPAIHIAEITGPYIFDPNAENPFYHYREVKWLITDVPRSNFDQDILYSFGAFLAICQIKRNDAEKRVRAMAMKDWKATGISKISFDGLKEKGEEEEPEGQIDLELLAKDQIAKLIGQKFKGHDMSRLIEAILKAQGYTTFRSPEGPDKGIDILAAPGLLGFGNPRICVQVKSGDSPVDLPTLNQLIGSMQNVQADQGLLVSWGGFKTSVDKEIPTQFFRVRLWNQSDIINELLLNYDRLDEDLRAELPVKRIWTLALQEKEG